MAPTLVLGLGNTLLSDDGAGVHALRYLERQLPAHPALELLDGGTLSFSLLPAIERVANLVVLDATQMNADPGTVRCFEDSELDGLLARPRRSVHEVSLLDLLSSARLAGTLPRHRALVGVQPGHVGWGDTLSAAVEGALPWMADIALECCAAWTRPAEPVAMAAASEQP
jgi:hydrogenase maturation protease